MHLIMMKIFIPQQLQMFFGIKLKNVTPEQRSHAKIVNFGIIYGVSAFGLSNQTKLSRSESKRNNRKTIINHIQN